jgi:hypothetical protein
MKFLMVAILGGGAVGIWSACQTVTCGEGTVEIDGVCSAEGTTPGGNCGAGTVYDKGSGRCIPTQFACDGGNCGNCGSNTELVFDDAGVAYCKGTGEGTLDCNEPPNCSTPGPGRFMVCGRLYDLTTSERMEGADLKTELKVEFYDALAFANDPTTSPIGTAKLDACGRYVANDKGVLPPFSGFVAVAIDDAIGARGTGKYAACGVAVGSAAGMSVPNLNTFVLTDAQDQAWSTAVASTPSLVKKGIYVPIFINTKLPKVGPFPGTPVANVKVTENSMIKDANDLYFGDTDPLKRLLPLAGTPGDKTGMNGTGIYTGGALTMYSGVGAEPAGCTWPSTLAATIADVVFVQERHSDCP